MSVYSQPSRQIITILFLVLLGGFSSEAQITKFSKLGDAIDAHDGEIACFNGTYYLYGTSYGCGFEWGRKDAPFCGFKAYSSPDLVHWTDRGQLFDASNLVWQTRCNGNTYGCFRPHVIYNKKTALYVLWINVYDNKVGYRVFTSKSPVGPFLEVAEPILAINGDAPVAGLNNGDHDTFVDDDGTAYLAYTDWRANGAIAVEQLSADYLTGTGKVAGSITARKTEAPALFKRKGIYYLVYSDPNCGYCSGTGASYRTAKSPLGPWSAGIRISDNSCGGQPSFVSSIKLKNGEVFLFGSDLWNNGAKNESLANYYWAPLTFAPDGAINRIDCRSDTMDGLTPIGTIKNGHQEAQTFKAAKSGMLAGLTISCFKKDYPNEDLLIDVEGVENHKILSSIRIPSDSVSWSPKNIILHPDIPVRAGHDYLIRISSSSTIGVYGLEFYPAKEGTSGRAFLFQTTILSK